MHDSEQAYNIAVIRKLLLAAFNPAEIRRFCKDRPTFRPTVDDFSRSHGLNEMVDSYRLLREAYSLRKALGGGPTGEAGSELALGVAVVTGEEVLFGWFSFPPAANVDLAILLVLALIVVLLAGTLYMLSATRYVQETRNAGRGVR